ncbi:MAG: hypothetical protein KA059_07855 [Elusimicrobiales bacterium]|nr:hypothetical protein [Elusimicrobiales bacterium]
MKDKFLPKSVAQDFPKPLLFSEQEELCRRLDNFHKTSGIQLPIALSSLFRGALYAMRYEYASENPDWMAQAAHSLREILYPFMRGNKRKIAFKTSYGSTYDECKLNQDVGRYYNFITDIAHHNFCEAGQNSLVGGSKNTPITITRKVFEEVVFQFGKILYEVLRRQIDAHHEIDTLLAQRSSKATSGDVNVLLALNPDACHYFFAKADEKWIDWLWENGFLDVIKEKPKDSTQYKYRIPELYYLERMAEKVPAKVVDIMLSIPVSDKTFNPEVVDRFLWICKTLPADQLARIVGKIKDEKWITLMGVANKWFEYEEMFKTLADVKDYKSILILAEAILEVRSKEEIDRESSGIGTDNPFYFADLAEARIFEYLANIADNRYAKQALALTTQVLTKIVLLGEKADNNKVFPQEDLFPFYDVDFFTLELGHGRQLSYRDDVIELAAVIKKLASRLISERCGERDFVRRLYAECIDSLPQSQAMWRLRLFVLSLCPEAFKEELKKAFFKLFEIEHSQYYEIIMGTEYKIALQKSFSVLSETDKHNYVANVIAYFSEKCGDADEQQWNKNEGEQILSVIWEHLTREEQQKAENAGMGRIPDYKPEPSISEGRVGWVSPKGPISQEEFGKLSITDITTKLRTDWTPDKLQKQETPDNFLTPQNAEGVAELLKNDIPKRLQDYIDNAELFFERDVLAPHYIDAYFDGIRRALHENKTGMGNINWQGLISVFIKIKNFGKNKSFEQEKSSRNTFNFLIGWNSVHSNITDVIKELLVESDGKTRINFSEFRDRLFEIISYLLNYPDPVPEDELVDTDKIKSQASGTNYLVADPLTTAINSVRGRAFESFVYFIYQDGKKFVKDDAIKLSADVKNVYEEVLEKENTRALMFMFGHYLPSFYFRDKEWIRGLLPKIFPTAEDKKHLYLAAWEGYLAANLYKDMFFEPDFQKLYERGLMLTGDDDPGRKYFKKPEEGIAIHLALAFVHFDEFGFDHQLFKKFWENSYINQHSVFIRFIGRSIISENNDRNNELLEKKSQVKQRLKDFWDWMLKNYKQQKPFAEFGFWVNPKNPVFDSPWLANQLKRTLEITKGVIDWDYGIANAMPQLAKEAPEDTLAIARLFFLEGSVRNEERRLSFYWDNKCFETLKILYANTATKSGVYTLIDDLIREGGSIFWKLKEIIENKG